MSLNPYESPAEVTDEPPRPTHPEVRQILYSLTADVVSGLYLLWAVPNVPRDNPLPLYEVFLFCFALGGAIVGPVFCLLSLVRWLIAK